MIVKVFKISSVADPETGLPGRQIELVEHRRSPVQPAYPGFGEEAAIVRSIVSQLQSSGLFPYFRETILPKIVLYLTEKEYGELGVDFEVNELYEIVMERGSITFRKVGEEGLLGPT